MDEIIEITPSQNVFEVRTPTFNFRWVKDIKTGEKILEQQIQVQRHSPCGGSLELIWEPIVDLSEEIYYLEEDKTHRYFKDDTEEI